MKEIKLLKVLSFYKIKKYYTVKEGAINVA